MNAQTKADILAAFDRSPGSSYDGASALRSLCEGNPDAVAVLAGIEARSPLPMLRATIASLPADGAARSVTAENGAAVTTKPKAKAKAKRKAK